MQKIIQIILFSLISSFGFSQNIEPLELSKKLLSKEVFEDIDKYSTGEFEGHPNGQDLGENVELTYSLLTQSENIAVVNITIKDSLGKGLDTYLHFEKDSIWKINAFRALAMTGMLEQMKNELEKMSESQIDSLIISQKDRDHKIFESKDDFKYQLENIKLTLEFDDNIIMHFNENKEKFETLKNEIINFRKDSTYNQKNINSEFQIKLNELYLGKLSNYQLLCEECIEFTIGGMIDNTVGYFYLSDERKLPKMNPSRIIMIREIGNGWYIFKTT